MSLPVNDTIKYIKTYVIYNGDNGRTMEQMSLFDNRITSAPLASRLRPETLQDYVGQKHLLGEGKMLRRLIEQDQISSMIFWGPPGVGKTTLARIIAGMTRADFVDFSAVTSGIKEIRQVMEQAEGSRRMGINTLLFVDEIHRFIRHNRTRFCHLWKREVLFWWEPLRKILLLRSIRLCCPDVRYLC